MKNMDVPQKIIGGISHSDYRPLSDKWNLPA